LNTATFIAITGVPVQMVRAVMAVVITVSLIVVIRAAEKERQRQFLAAQQARLDALQQVEKELIEREALRQNLMRHIVLAQEEERARIARELHDEVSQLLTAFSFHLAALRRAEINNTKAREQVDYLQGLSRQVSQGIYRLVHDLRQAQLDDLGLSAALLYLVDEQQRHTGLKTHVQISGERRRLDPLVETVFFRVAQEALANVARHARVQEAEMSLEFTPTQVALRVIDRGVGFDPQAPRSPDWGWGLAGMRERSDSIDGQLLIQSAPGQGTRIEIIVQHVPLLESMEQKTQLNNLTEVS
jgi:signal transduction histidine kinase